MKNYKKCIKTLDKDSENILESINQSINQSIKKGGLCYLSSLSLFLERRLDLVSNFPKGVCALC